MWRIVPNGISGYSNDKNVVIPLVILCLSFNCHLDWEQQK